MGASSNATTTTTTTIVIIGVNVVKTNQLLDAGQQLDSGQIGEVLFRLLL
jgi:hypothetical protein